MAGRPRTYLDYNASAPLLESARLAMIDVLAETGNASSVHHEGRNARKHIESARKSLSLLIGCEPANIIFASGATEAANHALSPLLRGGGQEIACSKLYVSAVEHPCILAGGRFAEEDICQIAVSETGQVSLGELEDKLQSHDHSSGAPLVAVQYVNNETGTIHPVAEIAELVHAHDGFFLVDAVQALGKLPFTLLETGADFLIVSSHKVGGPHGVGALVLQNAALSPVPLLKGGGQENWHRGGTENVAGIVGFGAACEWHRQNMTKKVEIMRFRDSIEDGLDTISQSAGNKIGPPVFFGKSGERVGNTSCFSVPGIRAETALMALDLDGVSLSSGSACSSGKVKASHVLQAMGAKPEEMEGALRLSLGWESTSADAEHFLKAWDKLVTRLAA